MAEENRAARLVRSYAAGETVFRDGDDAHTMFVVQSGRVRLYRELGESQQWLGDAGPGEFFGEMSILVDKPRTATALVVEDARLLELDARTFADLVTNHAEVAVRLLRRLAQRLDRANGLVEILMHRDPMARVVAALQRFAEYEGTEAEGSAIALAQDVDTFAVRTGLTQDEVRFALRRLHRLQLLEQRAEGVVLPDVMRLGEFQAYLGAREVRSA